MCRSEASTCLALARGPFPLVYLRYGRFATATKKSAATAVNVTWGASSPHTIPVPLTASPRPRLPRAGAVGVLAAICRGPRNDLRRFAARALGALGWNGHTEVP